MCIRDRFLELIKARYARYECVFIEVTEYPELEKARRLAGFYNCLLYTSTSPSP